MSSSHITHLDALPKHFAWLGFDQSFYKELLACRGLLGIQSIILLVARLVVGCGTYLSTPQARHSGQRTWDDPALDIFA